MNKATANKMSHSETPLSSSPTKVTIVLHGLDYVVTCDAGEEKKLAELVKMVDEKLAAIASRGTGAGETRLFMLACLMLADELAELKKATNEQRKADEALMVAAVEHLQERVLSIAAQIGK